MKPKLLLGLALVLFSTIAYGLGPTSVHEMNRTNLNASYTFLLIKSEQVKEGSQDMILFRVAVMMPNSNHHPADFSGVLNIKDGEKVVARVDASKAGHDPERYFPNIPKKFRAETVEYDFTISPKYLSCSDFMVCDAPSNCCYRFALKDFADEK